MILKLHIKGDCHAILYLSRRKGISLTWLERLKGKESWSGKVPGYRVIPFSGCDEDIPQLFSDTEGVSAWITN